MFFPFVEIFNISIMPYFTEKYNKDWKILWLILHFGFLYSALITRSIWHIAVAAWQPAKEQSRKKVRDIFCKVGDCGLPGLSAKRTARTVRSVPNICPKCLVNDTWVTNHKFDNDECTPPFVTERQFLFGASLRKGNEAMVVQSQERRVRQRTIQVSIKISTPTRGLTK